MRKNIAEAELDANKFGKFLPYELSRYQGTYVSAINRQNKFLQVVKMVPIFGLHESILQSTLFCVKQI
jgi:hypothetical protein